MTVTEQQIDAALDVAYEAQQLQRTDMTRAEIRADRDTVRRMLEAANDQTTNHQIGGHDA